MAHETPKNHMGEFSEALMRIKRINCLPVESLNDQILKEEFI